MTSESNSTNFEITNQHSQQVGVRSALGSALSSSLSLGANIAKCCLSTGQASVYGYFAYKFACSEIIGNLPILSISASLGAFPGAPLVYRGLSSVATLLVSHPMASYSLFAAYSFARWTNGIENIRDTIISIGDVVSNGVEVGIESYHAISDLFSQGSDNDSTKMNNDKEIILHAVEINGDEENIGSDRKYVYKLLSSTEDADAETDGWVNVKSDKLITSNSVAMNGDEAHHDYDYVLLNRAGEANIFTCVNINSDDEANDADDDFVIIDENDNADMALLTKKYL